MLHRIVIIIFCTTFLLLLSPLLFICGIFIILFDGGSIFFHQKRIGEGRETFTIWKLKTMNSQGISHLGGILRKAQIDEFPQVINIIQGDMNFIGPRALTPEDVERLGRGDDKYNDRRSIKPGITGLGQFVATCDKDITYKYDMHYIKNHNFGLDIYIVIMTICSFFIGRKRTTKLFYPHNKRMIGI